MQIIIDIPRKVNERLRTEYGHGYIPYDEHQRAIMEAIYNGKKVEETSRFAKGKDALISREAAIKLVESNYRQYGEEYGASDILCDLSDMPSAQQWIPVSEGLPKCEQEVLICTERKIVGKEAYIDNIITPAIYEDGTMLENDSRWHWEDIDYAGWDEEEDCGIIPEGWWENRHFNPDDVYNNPVDRKVVAWMPLPEPYKEDQHE